MNQKLIVLLGIEWVKCKPQCMLIYFCKQVKVAFYMLNNAKTYPFRLVFILNVFIVSFWE